MTRWITRIAGGRASARPALTPPDHRVVFARFAETLAARSPRVGLPRVREV
ncbi:MAG: hypothetical protein GX458_12200 [Phyllobacteriaceae bacterium]|nr:hypothetical protein [Phyllobacteriaceae bacterium]